MTNIWFPSDFKFLNFIMFFFFKLYYKIEFFLKYLKRYQKFKNFNWIFRKIKETKKKKK